MDVKTTFLNRNLDEEVYMNQPEGFCDDTNSHLFCKLNKSIYGLKHTSQQRYIKSHNIIISYGLLKTLLINVYTLRLVGANISFLSYM
jgi:hypothetical protein